VDPDAAPYPWARRDKMSKEGNTGECYGQYSRDEYQGRCYRSYKADDYQSPL